VTLANSWEVSTIGFTEFETVAKRVAAGDFEHDPEFKWRATASCRDTSPDLFFPIGTTGPAVDQISSAKIVCTACPSRIPCLEYALSTNQDSGVWGATSEEDRRHLRRTYIRIKH